MTRHIHVHFYKDANTAHDPKNGQFTSGPGGSGGGQSRTGPPMKAGAAKGTHYIVNKQETNTNSAKKGTWYVTRVDGESGDHTTVAKGLASSEEAHSHAQKNATELGLSSTPIKKEAPAHTAASLKKHPQYSKEDYEYLKGKGWSDPEIGQRWDEEHKADPTRGPAKGKPKAPDIVGVVADPNFYKK